MATATTTADSKAKVADAVESDPASDACTDSPLQVSTFYRTVNLDLTGTTACEICMDDLETSLTEMIVNCECNHKFCRDCWKE